MSFKNLEYVSAYYNRYDSHGMLIATNVSYHFTDLKSAQDCAGKLKMLEEFSPFVIDAIKTRSSDNPFFTVPVSMRLSKIMGGWTAYNSLAILKAHKYLPKIVMVLFPDRNWSVETLTEAFRDQDRLMQSHVISTVRIDLLKLSYSNFMAKIENELPDGCKKSHLLLPEVLDFSAKGNRSVLDPNY